RLPVREVFFERLAQRARTVVRLATILDHLYAQVDIALAQQANAAFDRRELGATGLQFTLRFTEISIHRESLALGVFRDPSSLPRRLEGLRDFLRYLEESAVGPQAYLLCQ